MRDLAAWVRAGLRLPAHIVFARTLRCASGDSCHLTSVLGQARLVCMLRRLRTGGSWGSCWAVVQAVFKRCALATLQYYYCRGRRSKRALIFLCPRWFAIQLMPPFRESQAKCVHAKNSGGLPHPPSAAKRGYQSGIACIHGGAVDSFGRVDGNFCFVLKDQEEWVHPFPHPAFVFLPSTYDVELLPAVRCFQHCREPTWKEKGTNSRRLTPPVPSPFDALLRRWEWHFNIPLKT